MILTRFHKQLPCYALIALLFAACRSNEQQVRQHQLSVFSTDGYTPSADSVMSPLIISLSERDLKQIAVGSTKAVPAHTNRFAAMPPIITPAKLPLAVVPGVDSLASPQTLVVRDSAMDMYGIEMVTAKDMTVKDPNPDNFSFYTKLQGLKHPATTALLQDKAGNIWIASRSGGLSRFDGQNFMHITEMLKGGARRVLSMIEDKEGNMWFGAETPGIYKYDGRRIVHLYDTAGRLDGYLQCLLQDKAGNLWIGSRRNGLFKYDGRQLVQYTTKQGLAGNNIRSLLEDRKGNIWIGTIGGGVMQYDGKAFHCFKPENGLPAKGILSLLQDKDGGIWMGTDSAGVIRFDGNTFSQYTIKQGLSNNGILSLLQDDLGNMWLGTDGSGAIRFDGVSFEHFGDSQGFPNKEVRCLLKDRTGNIWFGNYGSLARMSSFPFTHFTDRGGLLYNQNWSLAFDRYGNTWLGSAMGLCKYDGKTFTAFTKDNGFPALATVRALNEAPDGRLMIGFGSGGGFAFFDGKQFLYYRDTMAPLENAVQDIVADSKGNIWMANYQGGVYKYDGSSLTIYTTRQGLSSNSVNTIEEDSRGNIWIGTTDGGINKFDGTKFTHYTTKHGLPNEAVWSSHLDKAGNMWFGTEGGLVRYDGKQFTVFGEKEGMSTPYALSITEDQNGDMWFSTRTGLNRLSKADAQRRYDPESVAGNDDDLQNLFKQYGYSDGYLGLGGQSGRTIRTDRFNNIWACSNDRVSIYHKNREIKSAEPPKARLTGIQLYNEPIDWTLLEKHPDTSFALGNGVRIEGLRFDSATKWHRLPHQLSLAYNNNYLTFQYIGITMHQADRVKYQYMLEGNDKGWSGLTSSNRASYGNLSPGAYTFKVKAIDSNGDWSNEYTYNFTIRPPWWQTWWAYIVYVLVVIAAIKWLHNYQRQRVIRAERLRAERKELEQARAIEKAYAQLEMAHNNLKETQAQLVHSEKMASLGELTAGIAHEIQNPLNFINNFSEVNKELLDELKEELEKGNVEEAKTLANDVIGNEEKIIFHGRRADGIVKGMLQHSRSSSGTKEPTDINALCDEYLRLAYHGLRAKDKSFNSKFEMIPDATIGKIKIVPQDMGRVILNLINNAFYAVSAKRKLQLEGYEPKVTISTRNLGDSVQISVSDNGTGIPQKTIEKIFQPFFTTKPTGEGTGLGLSLSYDIVTKAHGGDLKVETKEGDGTTFIITLPKQQA